MKNLTIAILAFCFVALIPAGSRAADWEEALLDGGQAYRGLYPALAIDAEETYHISYLNAYLDNQSSLSYADLKYGTWQEGGWQSHWSVDVFYAYAFTQDISQVISLDIDSSNGPHLAYYNFENQSLGYAFLDNNTWQRETLSSEAGPFAAMAMDSSDNPHVVLYDVESEALLFFTKNGDSWESSIIADNLDPVEYCSLVIDSEDRPHIAYYDESGRRLQYANGNESGNEWSIQTVDSGSGTGQYASIALDGNDTPHIAYYDAGLKALKYASSPGAAWRSYFVDFLGSVGTHCSLKVTPEGVPHISYWDAVRSQIKYATFSNACLFPWLCRPKDDVPYQETFSGPYSSLDLNGDHKPSIVFFSSTDRPSF